jgi:hypothetical protein
MLSSEGDPRVVSEDEARPALRGLQRAKPARPTHVPGRTTCVSSFMTLWKSSAGHRGCRKQKTIRVGRISL